MRLQHIVAAAVWIGAATVLVQCGSSPATPTGNPTPGGVTPSADPGTHPDPGRLERPSGGHGLLQPDPAASPPHARQGPRRLGGPQGPRLQAGGRERGPLLRQGRLRRLEVLRHAPRGPPRAGGLRLPRHRQGGGHGPLGADLVLRERPLRLLPRQLRQPRDRAVHGRRQDDGHVRGLRGRRAGRWPRTARAAGPSSSSSGPGDVQRPSSRARIDFGRGHWHRFSGGTPRRACSTWAPQPAHVGFPHCGQRTWWHISCVLHREVHMRVRPA